MSANRKSKGPNSQDPAGQSSRPEDEVKGPIRKKTASRSEPEIEDEPPGDDADVRSPGGLPRFGDDEPDEPRRLDIEANRGGDKRPGR